jgi:hypothetical protein
MVVPALPAAGLAAASAAPSLLRFYDCSKVTSRSAALDLRASDGRANPRAPAARGWVFATFAPRPCFGLFRRTVRLSRCCARRSPASALGARTLKRDAEPEPGPHVLTTEVANEESVDGPWTDPMVGRNSSTRHPRSLLLRLSPLRRRASALARDARGLSVLGPVLGNAGGAVRRLRQQGRKGHEGAVNTTAASTQALAKTARQKRSRPAAPRGLLRQPLSEHRKA